MKARLALSLAFLKTRVREAPPGDLREALNDATALTPGPGGHGQPMRGAFSNPADGPAALIASWGLRPGDRPLSVDKGAEGLLTPTLMTTRALSSTLPAAGALRSPLGSLGGEALIITAALGLGGGLAQASSWGRRRPGGDELMTNIALGLGGGLAAHAVSRRGQGVGPESVSSTYCRSIIRPRHLSGPELVSFTKAFSSGLLKAGEELMEREGVFTLMDLIKVVGGEPRNLRLIGGLRLTTLLISLITARSLGCPNMKVNRGVLGRALVRLITFTFALSRGNRPQ